MTSGTESAQNPRTGGCLCGAVRYRIDTTTANWFAHEAGSYFRLDPDLDVIGEA